MLASTTCGADPTDNIVCNSANHSMSLPALVDKPTNTAMPLNQPTSAGAAYTIYALQARRICMIPPSTATTLQQNVPCECSQPTCRLTYPASQGARSFAISNTSNSASKQAYLALSSFAIGCNNGSLTDAFIADPVTYTHGNVHNC